MGRKDGQNNTRRERKLTSKRKDKERGIYNSKHVRLAEQKNSNSLPKEEKPPGKNSKADKQRRK
ncbi:hypothetical protein CPAV1605_251 [seawater metagenome]|uniref:Uncharacterized protein n=1 Tax=seawater metagenome TaxID=1561972 RepID=A0A5E8CHK5_9ZZZZ